MNIIGPPPSEVKHDRQLLQMEEQQISLCLRSAGPNTFMSIIKKILDFAFLQGSVCSFVFVFVFSSMQIIPLDLSLADCYK